MKNRPTEKKQNPRLMHPQNSFDQFQALFYTICDFFLYFSFKICSPFIDEHDQNSQ